MVFSVQYVLQYKIGTWYLPGTGTGLPIYFCSGPKSQILVILAILTLATSPLGILAPCHNFGIWLWPHVHAFVVPVPKWRYGTQHHASQVTALAARVQSCICWSSEAGVVGGARGPIFWKFVCGIQGDEIWDETRWRRDLLLNLLNLLLNYICW